MYDDLLALLGRRTNTQLISTTAGDPDGAYRAVMAVLDGSP